MRHQFVCWRAERYHQRPPAVWISPLCIFCFKQWRRYNQSLSFLPQVPSTWHRGLLSGSCGLNKHCDWFEQIFEHKIWLVSAALTVVSMLTSESKMVKGILQVFLMHGCMRCLSLVIHCLDSSACPLCRDAAHSTSKEEEHGTAVNGSWCILATLI